jgi:hypothetical protein
LVEAVDYETAHESLADRIDRSDLANMNPAEVVAAFDYCYAQTYGTPADSLRTNPRQWQNATRLARTLIAQFGSDTKLVTTYIDWAFQRERRRHKEARKRNGKYDRVIAFPLVLGGLMIDEFRIEWVKTDNGPLPEPTTPAPTPRKAEPGRRETHRKGEAVERPWFYRVMSALEDSDLPQLARHVVLVLAGACDAQSHETWLAQPTIAKRVGCSERTLRTVLSDLDKIDFPVRVTRRQRFDRSHEGGRISDLIRVELVSGLPAIPAGKGGN